MRRARTCATGRETAALSDDRLLSGLLGVIFDTRKLLVKLLFFLAEIERRRLNEDLGHKSLHEFCIRRYRMSLGAAHRRVTTLRLALRFPLRRKLEHARSMMRHSNPKGDLGVIVERAMDLLMQDP